MARQATAAARLVGAVSLLATTFAAAVIVAPGTASASTQTIAAHIYQCKQYTNHGVPDLETSTTEITGGTISVPSLGISQANPLAATTVSSAGTYTVEATVPAGYYFTECPGESTAPTLSDGDADAMISADVTSGSTITVDFYVVAFQTASCSATDGGVTCLLPDTLGLPFFPLNTLLAEANGVSSTVASTTPIVITAYGGNGGAGYHDQGSVEHGGAGGQGGEAQTALTSLANYEAANKTPLLYYYLGFQGITYDNYHTDEVGGLGGSSTIVSALNFATGTTAACIDGFNGCTSTNTVLVAGGGGGGGEGGDSDSGGHGGTGGTAIATSQRGGLRQGRERVDHQRRRRPRRLRRRSEPGQRGHLRGRGQGGRRRHKQGRRLGRLRCRWRRRFDAQEQGTVPVHPLGQRRLPRGDRLHRRRRRR